MNLSASSISGSAPLTVGFFLDGPTITDNKRWHFEDLLEEKNNSLLCTHTYQNPGIYEVWVDIIDVLDKVIETSNRIQIQVHNRHQHISFNQWEGIIYEGDSVGFSISHNIQGNPLIIWDWGDKKMDSSNDLQFYPDRLNPHHKYDKAGMYTGKVTITERTNGNGVTESKEFVVMVLPYVKKNIAGFIEITLAAQRQGNEGLPAKTSLNFQAQVTGVDNNEYSFVWEFGDRNGGSGLQISHLYVDSGTYHVKCTIRDKSGDIGNKIVLCKTVVINPKI